MNMFPFPLIAQIPTDHATVVWLAGILFACWSVR